MPLGDVNVNVNTQPEAQQLKRTFDFLQAQQKGDGAKPSPTAPAGSEPPGGGGSWFQSLRSSAVGMLKNAIQAPLRGLGPPGRVVAAAATTPPKQWAGQIRSFVTGMVWGIILDPFSELGVAGRIITAGLVTFGQPLITGALKLPFTLGKAGAAAFGGIGAAVGVAGGLAIAAAAIAFVVVPLINLGLTYKILKTSFRWAEDVTDQQMRVYGRARRTFPGAIGAGFEAARQTTWAKLQVVSGLFGQSADAMWYGFTRRMQMAQRGGAAGGAKDMFADLGITPQAVRQYEEMRGGERMGLNDMLFLFIRRREQLDAQIMATGEGTKERSILLQRKAKLLDSAVRLFGINFADMVGAFNSHDLRQLNYALMQAAPLGAPADAENAQQNTNNFKIALETVKNTFAQLKEGIVGSVQPIFTSMMENVRAWLFSTAADGETMAMKLRNLASSLAIHAWEALQVLIASISTDDLRGLMNLFTGWNPKKDLDRLLKLGHLLKLLFTPIVKLFKWAIWVIEKLKPLDKLLGGPVGRGGALIGKAAKGLWGAGETAGVWYKAYRAAGGGAMGRAAAARAVGMYQAGIPPGGGGGARGGAGAYSGGYAGVSGPLAATDSGAARKHIEGYLGKSITDREYDMLMRATHAESGGRNSPEEQAMIMGSILNRARTRGGIEAALTAKNQFQAVTGTRYAPGPSAAYRAGPGGARLESIQSASQLLARVPTTQINFTAASAAAYGAGTNIGYLGQLRRTGGAVYGGTQFGSNLMPGAGIVPSGGAAGGAGATAEWPTAIPPGGGRVVEEQGRVAGTRKMALAGSTRGWLERAAAESGVEVRVFSGGQPAIGTSYARTGSTRHDLGGAADIKLYKNGRVLDSGNPEDFAIMQRFTTAAVAAGATGIGAGYMGSGAHRRQAIHVGGGRTAAWGAGWTQGALAAGLERRRAGNIPRLPEPQKPVTAAVTTENVKEKERQQKEVEDKQARAALTAKAETKKKEREELTKPPPRKVTDEGAKAGKAAADAFKENIKDVSVPVKLPGDKDRETGEKMREAERQAA